MDHHIIENNKYNIILLRAKKIIELNKFQKNYILQIWLHMKFYGLFQEMFLYFLI